MNRISHYSFGHIIVDGISYRSDVIIYPDRVDPSWWRQEGHRLSREDLSGVLATRPKIVIIGTGALGVMNVPVELTAALSTEGMTVFVERTARAVELYNQVDDRRRVVAALHLTC